MSIRALEFSQAHPDDDPGYTAVVTQLTQTVDRAKTLEQQELEGRSNETAAVDRRHTVRDGIAPLVRHIARVCRSASLVTPELAGQIRAVSGQRPSRVYMAAVSVVLATATENKDALLAAGLGTTTLDDLAALVTRFSTETSTSHEARSQHTGAHAELQSLMSGAMLSIGVLDGLNRARFKAGSEELGAWVSAINVAGPFLSRSPVPAPTPPTEVKAA